MTALDAALMLGVTRRTVYRWLNEGRLSWPLDRQTIERDRPTPRRRGPPRNRWSARYVTGRHRYEKGLR